MKRKYYIGNAVSGDCTEDKAAKLGELIRDHISHVEAEVRDSLKDHDRTGRTGGPFRWRFKHITEKALLDYSYLIRVLKGQNNLTFIKLGDLCSALALNPLWLFARLFEEEGMVFCRALIKRFLERSHIKLPVCPEAAEEYIDRCLSLESWSFWELEHLPDSVPGAEELDEYFASYQRRKRKDTELPAEK